MGKTYDPNVDYMQKMEEAAAKGDYEQAAYYEEKRNEKIKGEGLSQYSLSHKYEAYLPVTTEKKMESILKKLDSREPFSYDIRGDKLYSQYRDQYTKAGSLAREDAVAQAASLTGGYGNSYGMTAGQSAYDREMERLTDLVPELYDRAREDYDSEGEALLDQYEALAKELERERDAALAQEKLDYEKEQDALKLEADRLSATQKANKEAQDQAYSLALSMLKSGLMPSSEVLQASGISTADADALYQANRKDTTTSGSGGGKTSTGKTSSVTSKTSTQNTKTKDLTAALWDKLSEAYERATILDDMTDFYRLHSSLKAQGYNTDDFDVWARQSFGSDYTSAKEKKIHWDSVADLGYGPISESELQKLVREGKVISYTQGDYIYYKKAGTPANLPMAYGT